MPTKTALVVYYSRTGTTRKVAEKIAAALKCDIEEIIDTRDRSGAWGWLRGGGAATRSKQTIIRKMEKEPGAYDVVIIGTPVWAFTMTPAVRTFIADQRGRLKEVAFFCTMGGSGDERTFRKMEELCGKKPAGVLSLKTKDVMAGAYDDPVRAFVNELSGEAPLNS
jgi:flavodoxin